MVRNNWMREDGSRAALLFSDRISILDEFKQCMTDSR